MPGLETLNTGLVGELRAARLRGEDTLALCRPSALYERPIPERRRIVFYLGHLDAVDWNLLCRHHLDLPSFHPSFDRLFAFGIDPPVGSTPNDAVGDWPSLDEVRRYNRRVRETIPAHIEALPAQLLHVAIEHRLMHAVSLARQTVCVTAIGFSFVIEEGETIWTESSRKYSLEDLDRLARDAGFTVERRWVDSEWPFAETLMST